MATHPISGSTPAFVDESRYERVDGQWIERPVPGARHSDIQFTLTALLKALVEPLGAAAREEWSLTKPLQASLEQPDYLTADVLVSLPGPYETTRRGHLVPPALLAVEISSPGQDNQISKAERFFAWGVEHCWLINPETRVCLEYHGGNQIVIVREELRAGNLVVRIADVFGETAPLRYNG